MLVKGMMKGLLNTSYLNVLKNIHRSKVEVDLKERVKSFHTLKFMWYHTKDEAVDV